MREFLKREAMPLAAVVLAAASMLLVPPDAEYLRYVDGNTIALLFCLMAVVAGLTRAGLFEVLSMALLDRSTSLRRVSLLLVGACFFVSMAVTNDVALIAFVPLTLGVFQLAGPRRTAYVVVLETVAANLGSMATPVGNPQNLYLYSFYRMDPAGFLATTAPYVLVSFVLVAVAAAAGPDRYMEVGYRERARIASRPRLVLHLGLFVLCLLSVVRILPTWACLAATLVAVGAADRRILARIDHGLLVTFVAFFVLVGNLARLEAVRTGISAWIEGRVLLAGVLASQVISNVPAAILLSGFTDQAEPLLLGVDIGGLGTLVASLASLISFRLYAKSPGARPWLFLGIFTAVNAFFLVVLLGATYLFTGSPR